MTRAEEAANIAFDDEWPKSLRLAFQEGYEQAEKDIIGIIETRISEIMGDAQPGPVLRIELRDLIKKIKDE